MRKLFILCMVFACGIVVAAEPLPDLKEELISRYSDANIVVPSHSEIGGVSLLKLTLEQAVNKVNNGKPKQ